jgi:hypothetical protein
VRGNGLSAHEYRAVADLPPGTVDLLLAALRDRGMAAYAATSPDLPPDGDVDRLYVDVTALEQARALIDVELTAGGEPEDLFSQEETPPDPPVRPAPLEPRAADGTGPFDVDAAFDAIVAGFHATTEVRGVWPAAEDLEPEHEPQSGPADPGGARRTPPGPGGSGPIGWEDLLRPLPVPAPEPEQGYVPPPPPPLPETSIGTRFAWAAVLGGPAVLFAAVLLGWQLADWMMLAASLAFLGGFVALVTRLGDRPEQDDDGAVV